MAVVIAVEEAMVHDYAECEMVSLLLPHLFKDFLTAFDIKKPSITCSWSLISWIPKLLLKQAPIVLGNFMARSVAEENQENMQNIKLNFSITIA